MRKLILAAVLSCASSAWAQSISITEIIEPVAPGITVRLVRESDLYVNGQNVCNGDPAPWECGGSPPTSSGTFTIGTDAAGNIYHVTPAFTFIPGEPRSGRMLRRVDGAGATADVARVLSYVCTDPTCAITKQYSPQGYVLDVTNGRIVVIAIAQYCAPGISPCIGRIGVLEISGLPAMFDTVLTFVPGNQLAVVAPAHPDGFRSADSLQAWTGDVRTLPNWSQAQPLTCDAATAPAPGQLVSVADTLPDPAVGAGRYYVLASQSGTNRRLGRQYVNGGFSARDPSTLPVCQ